MVNFVFHLKSDEGHIERFSFDVYMSPLPIFTKIKHPFAWHISFLVRHLSKYSVWDVCVGLGKWKMGKDIGCGYWVWIFLKKFPCSPPFFQK